jgi:hypothetical protein
MTQASLSVPTPALSFPLLLQQQVDSEIEELLASFPKADGLTPAERRGIIARYAAVLEGNFIYWMTGALLAVKSEEARAKIMENLHEEIRDSHPAMMRRFAVAAQAVPTQADSLAVYPNVLKVRLFIGRLSPAPILITMAFFEGFIQKFMPYLADLAARQGSSDMEYTDVHGVCDIGHTQELWNALAAEIALENGGDSEENLREGVELLTTLIHDIRTAPRPS